MLTFQARTRKRRRNHGIMSRKESFRYMVMILAAKHYTTMTGKPSMVRCNALYVLNRRDFAWVLTNRRLADEQIIMPWEVRRRFH